MREEKFYVVKEKDTLFQIAKQFGISIKQLMELNHLSSTLLQVGQILLLQKPASYEKKLESYDTFLETNKGIGLLKVQALIGNTYFPIQNVQIEISKQFSSGKQIFFSGFTQENGQIDSIYLPAPIHREDYLNGASFYQIQATHPNYQDTLIEEVAIYDGIKSLQKIEMIPHGYSLLKGRKQ